MSERHPGKEHELPSFTPEWGHPKRLLPRGRQLDFIVVTSGGSWEQEALTGESETEFTRTTRNFIGFRLVRPE